jgi:hypothetical protein
MRLMLPAAVVAALLTAAQADDGGDDAFESLIEASIAQLRQVDDAGTLSLLAEIARARSQAVTRVDAVPAGGSFRFYSSESGTSDGDAVSFRRLSLREINSDGEVVGDGESPPHSILDFESIDFLLSEGDDIVTLSTDLDLQGASAQISQQAVIFRSSGTLLDESYEAGDVALYLTQESWRFCGCGGEVGDALQAKVSFGSRSAEASDEGDFQLAGNISVAILGLLVDDVETPVSTVPAIDVGEDSVNVTLEFPDAAGNSTSYVMLLRMGGSLSREGASRPGITAADAAFPWLYVGAVFLFGGMIMAYVTYSDAFVRDESQEDAEML